ncbi:MAG: ArsR/SmtB family transcription factor [Actinomycetota bacterium]
MNTDAALKALAEPNRRAILQLVRDGPRSMGEIADNFRITPQAVSQHLKVLKDAGLVREDRQGRRHLFAVRPEGFEAVQEFLEQFWGPHLNKLKNVAERTSVRAKRRG